MTRLRELDPAAIRRRLEVHRKIGTPWRSAWLDAVDYRTVPPAEKVLYAFMERNFQAAYHADASRKGRCVIPERDVSNASLMAPPRSGAPSNRERCRSGDGCDRLATRGTFGKHFCDHHGAELERLSGRLALNRAKADPRNGGNTSLFTHQAA